MFDLRLSLLPCVFVLSACACTRTEPHDAGVVVRVDAGSVVHASPAIEAPLADAGSVADFERLHAIPLDVNWQDIRKDPRAECTLTRGTWRQYGNGCRDDCALRVDAECTFSTTWGCDCGPDRCTARRGFKETCVPNPIWHKRVYRGAVVERPAER